MSLQLFIKAYAPFAHAGELLASKKVLFPLHSSHDSDLIHLLQFLSRPFQCNLHLRFRLLHGGFLVLFWR